MNPTNRCAKENIEEWIKPILEKEGLTDYTVTVSGNTEKGDGYMGDITFVQVSGLSPHKKTFNFVIKSGKRSQDLRNFIPIRNAFENEIFYYQKILPEFAKFQQEKSVQEPFQHTTKCYHSLIHEDMEVLILENMKINGYCLYNRKYPLPRNHIELVMKTYGKLHAISYALKDQKPKLFQELSTPLVDIFKKIEENMKSVEEHNLFKYIINAATEENEIEIIEKAQELNKLSRNISNITDPNDPYAIILHGDCWNNNFLFKYEDKEQTKLLDVCLLDFQLTRLASPAYDLSYFLFTCLSEEDIQYFDEFITLYYKSLCKNLREMGSDPEKMLPFEELLKQLKKFAVFGIIMMPSLVKMCLSENDEVLDLAEVAESGNDFGEMFNRAIRSSQEFKKRTLPLMKLAIKKGFI